MPDNTPDLHVQIERRFKAGLQRRFDLRRVEYFPHREKPEYLIVKDCNLCGQYLIEGCLACPFGHFEDGFQVGCQCWIQFVLDDTELLFETDRNGSLCWYWRNNKSARQQIQQLKQRARTLIEWVD